ncbi:hypothetical protein ONE63_001098 [Megalurothrips usitatus]|uniref:Uncharacterized protein n=1 Tax=Megalurothrips usitatus TaxID=439358 RepID=A0AAV7XD50_9NEOP|nr:hypothetical protein ONE63_001098 [Megalurothrips usitatus]
MKSRQKILMPNFSSYVGSLRKWRRLQCHQVQQRQRVRTISLRHTIQKRRFYWRRPIFAEHETHGAWCTLIPALRNDPEKFYNIFRIREEDFEKLLKLVEGPLKKKSWQKPVCKKKSHIRPFCGMPRLSPIVHSGQQPGAVGVREFSLESLQAETQRKKRVQKIVLAQRERMPRFMLDHPSPASGSCGAPDGSKSSKRRLLEEKTSLLNSCSTGASKSREKRMKSGQDCRSQKKSKASKLKRLRGATGGGEQCPISLANLDEPLPAFLGPESVSGQQNADSLELQISGPAHQPLNVLLQFQNSRPNHQPFPALLEFSDTSPVMAAQCAANGAAIEHIELTDVLPVGLEHTAKSEVLVLINELRRERLSLEEQMIELMSKRVELKRENLEIEKKRLEMEREQSRVIREAVQEVSSGFCTAMQIVFYEPKM